MQITINRLRQNKWMNYYILFTRFLIGFAFIPSGLSKLVGDRFTTIPTTEPIGYFFEGLYQTGLYWNFLGLCQVTAAFLLITQRYATIGALLFLGIITNIVVITLSMDFNYTPVITILMWLATLTLILWDWNKIKILFSQKAHEKIYQAPERISKKWHVFGLIFYIIIVCVLVYSRTLYT